MMGVDRLGWFADTVAARLRSTAAMGLAKPDLPP